MMIVSDMTKSIFVHFLNGTTSASANITGHWKLSTNFTLKNISDTEKRLLMIFLALNIFCGNLFRFLVLRVVTEPSALVKPINKIILLDEQVKAVA